MQELNKTSQKLRKKNKHDKIVSKLNGIEALMPEALIDSSISHDQFVLINNVRKENGNITEEIKNLKT